MPPAKVCAALGGRGRLTLDTENTMRVRHLILAAALFAGPGYSFAREEANGPNGGQIADVQGHHVEFTVKDKKSYSASGLAARFPS